MFKKATKTVQAPEIKRPQEPKKPYPYREEDVVYENAEAGIKLAGTLTLPRGQGPFPAVLLITGSGPQDRDGTVFGHRPFLVLADYLTRRGIAVLRTDDRGFGKSTGDFSKATSADFASDARAGVEYLKSRKEIDPKKIGLIGSSEGGLIAPLVATQSPDVAFIVLLAAPGVPGTELLLLQSELIARAAGASEEAIARSRAMQEQIFAVLKEEKDDTIAEQRLRAILKSALEKMSEAEKEVYGISESEEFIEAGIKQSLTSWFRYFVTYDPRPTLMKVRCPVLAIYGEKDLQVPPGQNLPAIVAALEAGGNSDYTVIKLPGLNHLFQTSQTGAPWEYAQIEETFSPIALEVISDWILQHTRK